MGIKSAHFAGSECTPYEHAEENGKIAGIPVIFDFASNTRRTMIYDLLNEHFRAGDIYTHMYGGHRGEQDPVTKGPSKAMLDGLCESTLRNAKVVDDCKWNHAASEG